MATLLLKPVLNSARTSYLNLLILLYLQKLNKKRFQYSISSVTGYTTLQASFVFMGGSLASPCMNCFFHQSDYTRIHTLNWECMYCTLFIIHFVHSYVQSTVVSLNCSSPLFYLLYGHTMYPVIDFKNIISDVSVILYSFFSKFQFSQWYCHYFVPFQHCSLTAHYKFHEFSLLLVPISLKSIIIVL